MSIRASEEKRLEWKNLIWEASLRATANLSLFFCMSRGDSCWPEHRQKPERLIIIFCIQMPLTLLWPFLRFYSIQGYR